MLLAIPGVRRRDAWLVNIAVFLVDLPVAIPPFPSHFWAVKVPLWVLYMDTGGNKKAISPALTREDLAHARGDRQFYLRARSQEEQQGNRAHWDLLLGQIRDTDCNGSNSPQGSHDLPCLPVA